LILSTELIVQNHSSAVWSSVEIRVDCADKVEGLGKLEGRVIIRGGAQGWIR